VVQWCTDALDEVRRDVWNAARKGGMRQLATELKGARYALWKNPEVRHEAPCIRAEVKGLRRRPVAAGCEAEGSLNLGAQERVGSSPDNDGTGRHCQMIRVRQARRGGVREKPAPKPHKNSTGPKPGGHGPGCSARPYGRLRDWLSGLVRRSRGKPAAYSWRCCWGRAGHLPRRPVHGERGNHPVRPPLRPARPEDGQARCRLMAGWGGAPVVVRGRESRPHGKGGQRVLQQGNATSGGRW
jgi:hypothetical protein